MGNMLNRFIKASAGTGKTYTIVNFVTDMVTVNQIPLKDILIVTYTEKAVGELKERIRNALSEKNKKTDDAQIYTIHSFCQRVLEDYAILAGQPSELELIDGSEVQLFVDKWIREELTKNEEMEEYLRNQKDGFDSEIKRIKVDLVKALELYDSSFSTIISSGILTETLLKDLYSRWQTEKGIRKVQTYNDMIRFVSDKVTEENSKLTDALRNAYRCAIIDEFQDTNGFQWDIFKRIFLDAEDDKHFLFVVGDEKQSIYGFQGADLNVYFNAEKQYTAEFGISAESLNQNWRSSKQMIDACNNLFEGDFFNDTGIEYCNSFFPVGKKYNKPLLLCGNEINPFWFYSRTNQENGSFCDEYEFADFVVNRIMFCCMSRDKQTNLQIPKLRKKKPEDSDDYSKNPDNWSHRNAEYSDFAVLARTSSEMAPIESALRKYHIPYTRYKDKNLFNSMECQHWISILNAIEADDFSGNKKSILMEALFSKFFSDEEKKNVSSIDSPSNPQRQRIMEWHELAEKRKWADLIESIFEDSDIEERLSLEKKYLSVSRFRQIGMTILEMLYENACTISDIIHDLTKKMNQLPDDGDLVEKGTDKKTVQIMTIHAAKGLEFPVVIPVAGFKGRFRQIPHVYTYYDKNRKVLSFDKNDDSKYWDSYVKELKRLFYVAYTRAQYLMIIPRYPLQRLNPEDSEFIRNAINNYIRKHNDEENFATAERLFNSWQGESAEEESGSSESESSINPESIANTRNLITSKHSYSSLSNLTVANTDSTKDTEDENGDPEDNEETPSENDASDINPNPLSEKYPKGSKAGNAVHTIFELADFRKYGEKSSYEELANDDSFKQLVHDSFWEESIDIDEADSLNIRKQTASYVWNTLNAKLPIIVGGEKDGRGFFQLKELKQEDRLAEIEFHLDSETDETVLRHYCMGFIDLLFKHETNGKQVFSIIDWKTDTKLDGKQIDYSCEKEVKNVVDSEYRIQRTLYSYCLVKWLLQFQNYGDNPKDVFDNYFGGIYYILIRGCKANTDKAIYRHQWKSWEELESEYRDIITSQMQ